MPIATVSSLTDPPSALPVDGACAMGRTPAQGLPRCGSRSAQAQRLRHPFRLGYAGTDSMVIPWCTYTTPEIAHVGMYKADATAKGIAVETFTCRLDEVDRAILDGEEEGFARVHVKKGTDTLLGVTIVAAHAGDLI